MNRRRLIAIIAIGVTLLGALMLWRGVYRIAPEDKPFDRAFGKAIAAGGPIDLSELQPGAWSQVCGVGEGAPREVLEAFGLPIRPAIDETELDNRFDSGSAGWADEASNALVFVGPEGAQVRPVSSLEILSGGVLDICVPRRQATLVRDTVHAWRFKNLARP